MTEFCYYCQQDKDSWTTCGRDDCGETVFICDSCIEEFRMNEKIHLEMQFNKLMDRAIYFLRTTGKACYSPAKWPDLDERTVLKHLSQYGHIETTYSSVLNTKLYFITAVIGEG